MALKQLACEKNRWMWMLCNDGGQMMRPHDCKLLSHCGRCADAVAMRCAGKTAGGKLRKCGE